MAACRNVQTNSNNLLEVTLRDILGLINPTRDDWDYRFQIMNELRAIVLTIESLRGATVEPFGSFVSNLFTRWGDLDISIELPNGSYISSLGKNQKRTLLEDVQKALRNKAGFRRLRLIPEARVPILKFVGSHNISCDISINNLSGQVKSKVLFWINVIDGRYRDLVLLVKEWAKAYGINDSKSGTLNSYSLSLLVIFHLQTLVPAILPPMKEIYPGNMIDDLIGVRVAAENHIEGICEVNINRIKSDKSRLVNRSSLSDLFISFLAKFSTVCNRAETQGVCPYSGQLEDIDTNMRWLPKTYALYVEDPFEQTKNTARTVSSYQLKKISEAISTTYQTLISHNQNRASIVSVLVGPHISRFLVREPMVANMQYKSRTPANHTKNGFKTHQGKNQTSQQSHYNNKIRGETSKPNRNMDKSEDATSNGSSEASTSRKPKVWKPRYDSKVDQVNSDS